MAGSSYKGSEIKSVDQFISGDGLDSAREKEIGQHIGYRYDVNLVPDYDRLTPFLRHYLDLMGWDDLNWVGGRAHGLRGGEAPRCSTATSKAGGGFRRTSIGPTTSRTRDMIARELLIKFQMSERHPLVQLRDAYKKF